MSRLDPTVWAGEPEVSGVDGLLIDLPHRGNRLVIACRHCGHRADLSGRDICLRFTASLAAPVEEWAAALSCSQCRSRWILVSCENDSAAQGFIHSTQDNGQMIWARRLQTYLVEAGTSIEAFRSVLRELPMRAEMADLLKETV
jgi:hypothetical protein